MNDYSENLSIETWKKLNSPYDKYSVSSIGRIRNDKTGYILHPYKHPNGYTVVKLQPNNKNIYIHILVASVFDIPGTGEQIHHINGNSRDNSQNNLKKVSISENLKLRKPFLNRNSRPVIQLTSDDVFIKRWVSLTEIQNVLNFKRSNISACCRGKTQFAYGFIWKYEDCNDLADEEWVQINYEKFNVWVSSAGRIMTRSGKKTAGHRDSSGYMRTYLSRQRSVMVHILVALAFLRYDYIPGFVVNHKNMKKDDNRPQNLEWCSQGENIRYSAVLYDHRAAAPKRKVTMIDGNVVREFDSIQDASRATGIRSGYICNVCTGRRKKAGGFFWRYSGERYRN